MDFGGRVIGWVAETRREKSSTMAKILVVDDETVFVELIGKILKTAGYDVIAACDGQDGLEKAKKEKPDLIVLDVMMPKMDGYTMLKEIRKDATIKNIPVILCTGKAQKDYIEVSQGIGVDAYLTKPIYPFDFLAKVKELLP